MHDRSDLRGRAPGKPLCGIARSAASRALRARSIAAVLVLGVVACKPCGCRGRPAWVDKGDPNLVVEHSGGSRFGWSSFTIDHNGRMKRSGAIAGSPPETREGSISAAQLRALGATLRDRRCCGLCSTRTTGVPDEGHTALILRFAGLRCRVELWDNEWRSNPEAARCIAPIDRLSAGLARSGDRT